MSRELDEWRRDQINSRPTACRKMRAFEAALAEKRFRRNERIDAILWWGAMVLICAMGGSVIAALIWRIAMI